MVFLLTSSSLALADKPLSSPRYETPIDKEWKIEFSIPVDEVTLAGNIYVTDENGKIIATKPIIGETDAIVMLKPVNNYEYLTTYFLYVNKGIKSKDNHKDLLEPVKIEFTTIDKEGHPALEERILGSWSTSYSGIGATITFNEDKSLNAKASIASASGSYKITEDIMSISLMGRKKTGKVVFIDDNSFEIVESNGNSLRFSR